MLFHSTKAIVSFLIKSKASKVQLGMYNFTNAVEQLTQMIEMDVIPVWKKHHSQREQAPGKVVRCHIRIICHKDKAALSKMVIFCIFSFVT